MRFSYSPYIQKTFPQLVTGLIAVEGIDSGTEVAAVVSGLERVASERLTGSTEAEFPEIKAWRGAYATMGLKPTQYRCASEALLRRFRKEGHLPAIHPLIDLCNAISLAFAVPVAVFDLARIEGDLTVRQADGTEAYLTFAGETERPEPGEVIFADGMGNAHARRWANRQSRLSAVSSATRKALIVSEALHATAASDMRQLVARTEAELKRASGIDTKSEIFDRLDAVFESQEIEGT